MEKLCNYIIISKLKLERPVINNVGFINWCSQKQTHTVRCLSKTRHALGNLREQAIDQASNLA